ncbi:MAG: cobalamin B12-binding domain-containing protein [Acidobacteria bacterium]|nr:cobalamin B12-binding domain-containing protein [Acidobacteriota bacterium]
METPRTKQRPLRVLVAKPGLDGHDKGAKVVAQTLRDAGCEVIYTGLHKSVEEILHTALQEDVDVIGLSVLSGNHLDITRELIEGLRAKEMGDVAVLIGGNIPHRDRPLLLEIGASGVFATGARLTDIVSFVRDIASRKGLQ